MVTAIIGDQHGNLDNLITLIEHLAEKNVKTIIQVGDFAPIDDGFWSFIKAINALLEHYNMRLHFIDGNHDNHHLLQQYKCQLRSNVFYQRRGSYAYIEGLTYFFVGGAYTVNRKLLTENMDYWKTETLSASDYEYCLEQLNLLNYKVDVFVCHDLPYGLKRPKNQLWFIPENAISKKHRKRLKALVDKSDPQYIVHGHYHTKRIISETLSIMDNGHCDLLKSRTLISLGRDGDPLEDQYFIIN